MKKLCAAEPVFAELRSCMDLAVVAALIQQEHLCDRVQLQLTTLLDANVLPHVSYHVPKQVPTIASIVKKSGASLVSASGGVSFQPWEAVQKPVASDKAGPAMTEALASRKSGWWWNVAAK